MNALTLAKEIAEEITGWCRDLHRIPEIGLNLPKTAAYVTARLDEMGISYQLFERHSGIVVLLGKPTGKTIALRADMDALPIKELVESDYKSENEYMHACGHDAHTAMLLGVAKILKTHEDELNGQVKLLFQPAEEGPGGAAPMIEDGVLENPKVDAILALHCDRTPGMGYQNGDMLVKYGNITAADDQIDIRIFGKGGHGAQPHLCVDPVAVAALVINNLQYIISREVKPGKAAVITLATVQAGRGAENIIPDEVYIRGTVRNSDMETRAFVFQRIDEILKGTCMAMRADYELKFDYGYPPVFNEQSMTDGMIATAKNLLGDDKVKLYTEQAMGGEDAGFFYQKVPGCFFRLYNPAPFADGEIYPGHNARFVLDDSILYEGTALLAQGAVDFLNR